MADGRDPWDCGFDNKIDLVLTRTEKKRSSLGGILEELHS